MRRLFEKPISFGSSFSSLNLATPFYGFYRPFSFGARTLLALYIAIYTCLCTISTYNLFPGVLPSNKLSPQHQEFLVALCVSGCLPFGPLFAFCTHPRRCYGHGKCASLATSFVVDGVYTYFHSLLPLWNKEKKNRVFAVKICYFHQIGEEGKMITLYTFYLLVKTIYFS